jgi:hypothetical protein
LKLSLSPKMSYSKKMLVLIFLSVFIIILDSSFIRIDLVRLPLLSKIIIFTILGGISLFVNLFLVRFIHLNYQQTNKKYAPNSRIYFIIYLINQSIIFVFLSLLIYQMIVLSSYQTFLLTVIAYSSFITSFFFLTVIVYHLFNWFKRHKNKVILLYACTFLIFSIHILIGLIYLHTELSYKKELIKPLPPRLLFSLIYTTNYPITSLLTTLFDITFILSFILTWTTTAILLKQYAKKIGKIRYWFFIFLPLFYLFLSYELLLYYIFGHHISFYGLIINSNLDAYIPMDIIDIFFGSPKQIGGIFFGMVFWIIGTKINDDKFKKTMLATSAGIIFLYSSSVIHTVTLTAVPPHGLLTVPFMVLGAYMLTIGIFNTAINISSNIELRKEIYKSIEDDIKLLKNIGISQMEIETEKQYKKISKKMREKELNNSENYDLSPENIKEHIQNIIGEIHQTNKG